MNCGRHCTTALHNAACCGAVAAIRALLAAGADPCAKDTRRWEPIHWAADKGHAEAVSVLLAGGADIEAWTAEGCTPLWIAAATDRAAAVKKLVAAGELLHAAWSALHCEAPGLRCGQVYAGWQCR